MGTVLYQPVQIYPLPLNNAYFSILWIFHPLGLHKWFPRTESLYKALEGWLGG